MKTYTAIPSNYIKRNQDEIVREGDLYMTNKGVIKKVNHSIGHRVSDYNAEYFTIYRRIRNKKENIIRISAIPTYGYCTPTDHTPARQAVGRVNRKPANVKVTDASTGQPLVKKPSVPIVTFKYSNNSLDWEIREVQIISMDDTYLKGLEKTYIRAFNTYGCAPEWKIKWQFKTYRIDKIIGNITLISYAPAK